MGRWEENGDRTHGEAGIERWKSMGFHGISHGKLLVFFFSHDGNPWEFSMGRGTSDGWEENAQDSGFIGNTRVMITRL